MASFCVHFEIGVHCCECVASCIRGLGLGLPTELRCQAFGSLSNGVRAETLSPVTVPMGTWERVPGGPLWTNVPKSAKRKTLTPSLHGKFLQAFYEGLEGGQTQEFSINTDANKGPLRGRNPSQYVQTIHPPPHYPRSTYVRDPSPPPNPE